MNEPKNTNAYPDTILRVSVIVGDGSFKAVVKEVAVKLTGKSYTTAKNTRISLDDMMQAQTIMHEYVLNYFTHCHPGQENEAIEMLSAKVHEVATRWFNRFKTALSAMESPPVLVRKSEH